MSRDDVPFQDVIDLIDRLESSLPEWEGQPGADQASLLRVFLDYVHSISGETKECHADVDWRRLNALRNAFLHDYLGLSAAEIRSYLIDEFPRLRNVANDALNRTQAAG